MYDLFLQIELLKQIQDHSDESKQFIFVFDLFQSVVKKQHEQLNIAESFNQLNQRILMHLLAFVKF
jgi:hypothetical protein